MKSFIAVWFVPVTHLENDRLCLPRKRCLWSVPVNLREESLELLRHTDCRFDIFRWKRYDTEEQSRGIHNTTASFLVLCFLLARMREGQLRFSGDLCTQIKHSEQKILATEILVPFKTKSLPPMSTGVCCMITVDWKIVWRAQQATNFPWLCSFCVFVFFLITSWDCPLRPPMTPFSYTTFKKTFVVPSSTEVWQLKIVYVQAEWQINDLMYFILWSSLLKWPSQRILPKASMIASILGHLDALFIIFSYWKTYKF